MAAAMACGVDHPIGLAVAGLAAFAPVAFAGAVILDGTQIVVPRSGRGLLRAIRQGRRQYAGFVIHMGLICLAVGVAGSSLGKREQGFTMTEGQTVQWAGRSIRVARVNQRKLPDKLVGEAVLEISRGGRLETTLVPAQHYHSAAGSMDDRGRHPVDLGGGFLHDPAQRHGGGQTVFDVRRKPADAVVVDRRSGHGAGDRDSAVAQLANDPYGERVTKTEGKQLEPVQGPRSAAPSRRRCRERTSAACERRPRRWSAGEGSPAETRRKQNPSSEYAMR